SLRRRHLFGRGDLCCCRANSVSTARAQPSAATCERKLQRRKGSRSASPNHPPPPSRSRPGEDLNHDAEMCTATAKTSPGITHFVFSFWQAAGYLPAAWGGVGETGAAPVYSLMSLVRHLLPRTRFASICTCRKRSLSCGAGLESCADETCSLTPLLKSRHATAKPQRHRG